MRKRKKTFKKNRNHFKLLTASQKWI